MKRAYLYASAGLALAALALAPVPGRAADNPVTPNSSAMTTSSGVVTNPGEESTTGTTPTTAQKADFVSQKIAEAKSQGKDVTVAEAQEKMGRAALRKGMSKEADDHFDTALQAVGVMPNAPENAAGEAQTPHASMPGANHQ